MKTIRGIIQISAALLLAATFAGAQVLGSQTTPLADNLNLNGEAANAAKVVTVVQLADSTSYTIAAQPDVCRLIDVTIVDADNSISAGVLTVVGTDCWGDPLTTTYTFAAGGSGVKTLVVSRTTANVDARANLASGAYYKTITTVSNGALTGEGGAADTISVGYSASIGYAYPQYGLRTDSDEPPYRQVDRLGKDLIRVGVKNGTTSTDVVTNISAAAPFTRAVVGDLVYFPEVDGKDRPQVRRIVSRADANNIVVDQSIYLKPGNFFYLQHAYLSTDPQDGWIPTAGFDSVDFAWQEASTGANTGGIISNVECADQTSLRMPALQVKTDTCATGTLCNFAFAVDLRLTKWDYCRLGFKFGTNDDADASAATSESLYATVSVRR